MSTRVPSPSPDSPRRVGLWRTVVLNLAFLVLATLLLNAFLVWNLGSANRWGRRERLAAQTAALLAEQIEGTLLRRELTLTQENSRIVQALVDELAEGELSPYSVQVVDRSLSAIASAGAPWTESLPPHDLREAVLEGRAVQGSERLDGSLWGPRTVYVSRPVELGTRPVGGVRVAFTLGG